MYFSKLGACLNNGACRRLDWSARYQLRRCISSLTQDSNSLTINWKASKGGGSQYHYIWLRDNCQCSECYSPINTQRLIHPLKLNSDLQPSSVSQSTDQSLSVRWPDGHQSCYSAEWLMKHAYDGSMESSVNEKVPFTRDVRCEPLVWDREIASKPPRILYQSILESDEMFLEWNTMMETYGFCFIDETPLDLESMQKLVKKIGLVRNSLWGDYYVLGVGENSTGPSIAYADPTYSTKGVPVPPHTDGAYMINEFPALQLFQPLSFKGKEWPLNIFTDGFKLAEIVRKESEFHYKLLSSVPIPYLYEDDERKQYSSHFYFVVEPGTGKISRVQYCNTRRMIMNSYCMYKLAEFDPKATVVDLYEALHMFNRALYSEEVQYKFPLKTGTAVFTDNHRVLHSRTAYEGQRELRGCWINLDDWRGKVIAARDRLNTTLA